MKDRKTAVGCVVPALSVIPALQGQTGGSLIWTKGVWKFRVALTSWKLLQILNEFQRLLVGIHLGSEDLTFGQRQRTFRKLASS